MARQRNLDQLDESIEPVEENSWFYYLAELSLRRMMDRAMAAMCRNGEMDWMNNIQEKIDQWKNFNEQINLWYGTNQDLKIPTLYPKTGYVRSGRSELVPIALASRTTNPRNSLPEF